MSEEREGEKVTVVPFTDTAQGRRWVRGTGTTYTPQSYCLVQGISFEHMKRK